MYKVVVSRSANLYVVCAVNPVIAAVMKTEQKITFMNCFNMLKISFVTYFVFE